MIYEFSKKGLNFKISSRGAELVYFEDGGINYIWCGDPKYWDFSAPVLFPIIGKVKNLETTIKGKKYSMLQHGLLRRMEFNKLDEDDDSVSFYTEYNEETLKHYPFKFKAVIKYVLGNHSIKTIFSIENIDNQEIYFNIGGHPGINCPLNQNEKFEDYSIHFEKSECFKSPKVMMDATLNFDEPVLGYNELHKLNLKKEMFYIDTIIIKNVKSRFVELVNKQGKGVKFSFENFSNLAIWTPHNDAPFICLEPWQGYNDLYNTKGTYEEKEFLVHLQPKEVYSANYIIETIR